MTWSSWTKAEKAMATHSSTLAWKIPRTEEPGRLQSMGSWRVRHDWATSLSRTGEGNGNPLQCSCLENPRDGGAWWAAVSGVAQSWTQLKWLSSSSSWTKMNISSGTKRNSYKNFFNQFNSKQSLSHIQLFATPWTAAHQASLSITNSRSLLKLMSIKSVILSNHHPLSSPSPALLHPKEKLLTAS